MRLPSIIILLVVTPVSGAAEDVVVRGRIVDAVTGSALPARLRVDDADGKPHLVRSANPEGSAVPYRKERGASSEVHTTLSAHDFEIELPPGTYTLTAERGKEYLPATARITVQAGGRPEPIQMELRRWIDMAKSGWYSGDTHVHRPLAELPNLLLAEDLNIAFPLTSWVTEAFQAPKAPEDAAGPEPIAVDATHLIYPRNTEYEIFTVGGRRHTLGAVFLIGHRSVFERGVPPVKWVAEATHREGGVIELDKHNWPWSMAIIPVMGVDLYELSNNHIWEAPFAFKDWGDPAPEYMRIERDAAGFTEWGWIDYGFQNYYALLDCGFRLRPTAGTASGVHPVPLGFGRVYVHCPGGFGYREWLEGLNAGRSFVTTGPMLLARVDGKLPGEVFRLSAGESPRPRLEIEAYSTAPLEKIEVVINGEVRRTLEPANQAAEAGSRRSAASLEVPIEGSSWVAVRAIERRPDGRVRFAHTAPFHFDVEGKPIRPRPAEAEFLVRSVEAEIARSRELIPAEALAEYEQALEAYRRALERSRD
jgi:hypothetical protein